MNWIMGRIIGEQSRSTLNLDQKSGMQPCPVFHTNEKTGNGPGFRYHAAQVLSAARQRETEDFVRAGHIRAYRTLGAL
ncbi:MAG: hypothetical protein WBP66_11310, partial [Azonexus sp.]